MELPQLLEKGTPLITAIFGGIGIKVFEKMLSKRSEEFNDSSKIREELRQQITLLRVDVDALKKEADQWRQKYWEQIETNIKQKAMAEDESRQLISDLDMLKQHMELTKDRESKS